MVWELAAVAPACASCDDGEEILRVLREAALQVKAPSGEIKRLEKMRDAWKAARERAAAGSP
jgi:hypothetical protein